MHSASVKQEVNLPQSLAACQARCWRDRVLATAAARGATSSRQSRDRRSAPKHRHHVPDNVTAVDELGCIHFQSCSGCSISQQLHDPPVAHEARAFFASREFDSFHTVAGINHGWRCRAKLAVRGKAGDPQIGLFQLGSHALVGIPECRAHHPRINQAVQLIKQITAALRITPYAEQQQQHSNNQHAGGSSSSRVAGGFLRYIQLTVLPSSPGGRAENDPHAQVQVVLVWAAPDSNHPSVADARRLAAALWSQAGPKQTSQLAALRQRTEAAVRGGGKGNYISGNRGPNSNSNIRFQQQQQQGSVTPVHVRQQAAGVGAVPLLHSVWLNLQPAADSNAVLGHEWQLLHGQQWGWQDFAGVPVAIAPGGFVQANYGAMQQCLSAIAAATPRGSSVVEYYAGSGVIGLSLAAAAIASKVACVEVNPESSKAFEVTRAQLAKSNKAAADAVTHHIASADDMQQLQHLLVNSDASVLVVDPPRKGLDQPLLQVLTANEPSSDSRSSRSDKQRIGPAASGVRVLHVKRLIYLSCGFKALMIDTDALLAAGWKLTSCQAYFFFPGTDSIETLAVFDRD